MRFLSGKWSKWGWGTRVGKRKNLLAVGGAGGSASTEEVLAYVRRRMPLRMDTLLRMARMESNVNPR
jgi:hypothetical protein